MLTIEEIRRANLSTLVREKGSQAALSRLVGKSANQVNQWLGKGTARDMDSDAARMFEAACDKPRGWMDNSHASSGQSHSPRIDFEKISGATKVLTEYLELMGYPASGVTDPVLLEVAHLVVDEFGEPVAPSNVIDLTKILAKRVREMRADDGKAIQGVGAKAG